MKKALNLIVSFLAAAAVSTMILSGCSSSVTSSAPSEQNAAEKTKIHETSAEIKKPSSGTSSRRLVVYFTYAENTDAKQVTSKQYDATTSASLTRKQGTLYGNNAIIAEAIAEKTGGDLLSLKTKEPYSPDYDVVVKKAREDINNGVLPALSNGKIPVENYDAILLVYPIWWYKPAPAVETFLKENNLAGKDIYVFVTSGGTGFGDTLNDIKELQPQARIHQMAAFRQEDAIKAAGSMDSLLEKEHLLKK
jgi:flavodoxin